MCRAWGPTDSCRYPGGFRVSFIFNRDMGRIVVGAVVASYAVAVLTALAPQISPAGVAGRFGGR